METLQRVALLTALAGVATACAGPSSPSVRPLSSTGSGAMPPGLTCPVMTRVDYTPARTRTMLGASPDNPMICLVKRTVGSPERLLLNWYAADRLRLSDIDGGIEVLSSLLTAPVGFTTTWNRFLGNNQMAYETRFSVVPDQSITIGGKTYDVRVITAKNSSYEDNEYWFDKNSLTILKYMDHNTPSRNYTVTALTAVPGS